MGGLPVMIKQLKKYLVQGRFTLHVKVQKTKYSEDDAGKETETRDTIIYQMSNWPKNIA